MQFGDYIKNIRKSKGLTQVELAEESGVKRTYISKIESNKVSPPSEEVLIVLAKALNEDPYGMILNAGKVPSDFQKVILKDPAIFELIRNKLQNS
jgi:transcriptional regulator with XRE-family HTH domain